MLVVEMAVRCFLMDSSSMVATVWQLQHRSFFYRPGEAGPGKAQAGKEESSGILFKILSSFRKAGTSTRVPDEDSSH